VFDSVVVAGRSHWLVASLVTPARLGAEPLCSPSSVSEIVVPSVVIG